jgi:hypothetical protein
MEGNVNYQLIILILLEWAGGAYWWVNCMSNVIRPIADVIYNVKWGPGRVIAFRLTTANEGLVRFLSRLPSVKLHRYYRHTCSRILRNILHKFNRFS